MANPSIEQFGHNLPASGLAAASQAAVGFGAGLLVAGYLGRRLRYKLAIGLLTAGMAIFLPLVVGVVARVSNHPDSARRVRKRLESIRHDDGMPGHGSDFV